MMVRIDVYNPTLERVGVLYNWTSLVWKDSYNDGGSFQLEVIPSKTLREILIPDNFLVFSAADTVMVIQTIQMEAHQIIVNGVDAAHVLSNRIATGTVYSGVAETVIRNAVATYKGDWDQISEGTSRGLPETTSTWKEPTDLESVIQAFAQDADIGYRLNLDKENRQLVLDVYSPGENANAVFSPAFGNVADITYTRTQKELKNVCIVISSSQDESGEYPILATVGDTEKTGIERKEMILKSEADAVRESTYTNRGLNALAEQVEVISVDCTISGGVYLGEIVTIRVPTVGLSVKSRVTGIERTAQHGTVETTYTIGDTIKVVQKK